MMRAWSLWAVALVLLMGSCGGMEPVSRREMEAREYDQKSDMVYAALEAVLGGRGYEITAKDPGLGIVETDWLEGKYQRSLVRARVRGVGPYQSLLLVGIQLEERGLMSQTWKPKAVPLSEYENLFEEIDLQIYREYFHRIERKAREGTTNR